MMIVHLSCLEGTIDGNTDAVHTCKRLNQQFARCFNALNFYFVCHHLNSAFTLDVCSCTFFQKSLAHILVYLNMQGCSVQWFRNWLTAEWFRSWLTAEWGTLAVSVGVRGQIALVRGWRAAWSCDRYVLFIPLCCRGSVTVLPLPWRGFFVFLSQGC